MRAVGSAADPVVASVMSVATPTDRGGIGITVGTTGKVQTEVAENSGG